MRSHRITTKANIRKQSRPIPHPIRILHNRRESIYGYKTATWICAYKMLWQSCEQGGVQIKQFYRKFPQYRDAAVTARDFEPAERVEVDYTGDSIEWVDLSTGEVRKAYVFVSGLGFSQLLLAWPAEDTRSRNWLTAINGCSSSTAA
jgi:hypothetical protein